MSHKRSLDNSFLLLKSDVYQEEHLTMYMSGLLQNFLGVSFAIPQDKETRKSVVTSNVYKLSSHIFTNHKKLVNRTSLQLRQQGRMLFCSNVKIDFN